MNQILQTGIPPVDLIYVQQSQNILGVFYVYYINVGSKQIIKYWLNRI